MLRASFSTSPSSSGGAHRLRLVSRRAARMADSSTPRRRIDPAKDASVLLCWPLGIVSRIGSARRAPFWLVPTIRVSSQSGKPYGGGGIRTHEGFRPPVFKFVPSFCVWLHLVRSGCGARANWLDTKSACCVWLRPATEAVGKTLARIVNSDPERQEDRPYDHHAFHEETDPGALGLQRGAGEAPRRSSERGRTRPRPP